MISIYVTTEGDHLRSYQNIKAPFENAMDSRRLPTTSALDGCRMATPP